MSEGFNPGLPIMVRVRMASEKALEIGNLGAREVFRLAREARLRVEGTGARFQNRISTETGEWL